MATASSCATSSDPPTQRAALVTRNAQCGRRTVCRGSASTHLLPMSNEELIVCKNNALVRWMRQTRRSAPPRHFAPPRPKLRSAADVAWKPWCRTLSRRRQCLGRRLGVSLQRFAVRDRTGSAIPDTGRPDPFRFRLPAQPDSRSPGERRTPGSPVAPSLQHRSGVLVERCCRGAGRTERRARFLRSASVACVSRADSFTHSCLY